MGPAISSTPKACGVISHHPRRRRVTPSCRNRKLGVVAKRSTAGSRHSQAHSFCPWARMPSFPAPTHHPTGGGDGSLLASKVGSFLASAEGQEFGVGISATECLNIDGSEIQGFQRLPKGHENRSGQRSPAGMTCCCSTLKATSENVPMR